MCLRWGWLHACQWVNWSMWQRRSVSFNWIMTHKCLQTQKGMLWLFGNTGQIWMPLQYVHLLSMIYCIIDNMRLSWVFILFYTIRKGTVYDNNEYLCISLFMSRQFSCLFVCLFIFTVLVKNNIWYVIKKGDNLWLLRTCISSFIFIMNHFHHVPFEVLYALQKV